MRTAPMAYPLASVSTSKGLCKFGSVSIGAWMIFLFNSSNSFCQFFPHWKLSLLAILVWSGATTAENKAMNFHKYCAAPTKILTSVQFIGTGHFMMACILAGFILISPPSITYPRYTKEC
jgi:hypothetical protein